tara:strand:- start:23 stop:682 length:660 start_codon:yes stop_codon:yes gene_type:complete
MLTEAALKLVKIYSKRALRYCGSISLVSLALPLSVYAAISFTSGERFAPNQPFSGSVNNIGDAFSGEQSESDAVFSGVSSNINGSFTLDNGAATIDSDGDGTPDDIDNCIAESNVDQADFDEDGMGDVCDPDDDNDNLSDVDELERGTDPFNADSDGDGFTDYEEVSSGTNPLDSLNNDDANSDDSNGSEFSVPMVMPGMLFFLFGLLVIIRKYKHSNC